MLKEQADRTHKKISLNMGVKKKKLAQTGFAGAALQNW